MRAFGPPLKAVQAAAAGGQQAGEKNYHIGDWDWQTDGRENPVCAVKLRQLTHKRSCTCSHSAFK